ncbi:MAG: hypothetical protein A2Z14_02045 [Chloroflexi bacterium RBG_16_48_8]|nr:MAG: hypothetical protein A2Z14_02045 [Chloroflexi bacterium RBG_16_48_8]
MKEMNVEESRGSRAKYLAIIGDVVRSRDIQDRNEFQQRLRGGISKVNQEFSSSIASRFVLTIGDEFQGLLKSPEVIPQLLAVIRSEIHPIEQRIGIGIGNLDTKLEPVAIGMDGPCFHRARDAIERAKSFETSIEVESGKSNEPFRIYSLLYSNLRRGWTPRQRQVFDLSMIGMAGNVIAQQLRITPSAISQHLSAVGADVVFNATRIWVDVLVDIFNSTE